MNCCTTGRQLTVLTFSVDSEGLCNANLIERITFEYNHDWIHGARGCAPAHARDQLEDWGDTYIDRDINKNLWRGI
jgi:recombinational DNA repair protein (RecF pathway)